MNDENMNHKDDIITRISIFGMILKTVYLVMLFHAVSSLQVYGLLFLTVIFWMLDAYYFKIECKLRDIEKTYFKSLMAKQHLITYGTIFFVTIFIYLMGILFAFSILNAIM